jgi:acyl-CoA reductase-like NAD-dependent aldehyde dehydrogenase
MVLAICAPRLFRDAIVAASVQKGADLVTGGKRPASMGKGWYFEPTILARPGPKISSAREEGPG